MPDDPCRVLSEHATGVQPCPYGDRLGRAPDSSLTNAPGLRVYYISEDGSLLGRCWDLEIAPAGNTDEDYLIQLEISGPNALWSRPDTMPNPVSYVAPTFSAVKGIFESISSGNR